MLTQKAKGTKKPPQAPITIKHAGGEYQINQHATDRGKYKITITKRNQKVFCVEQDEPGNTAELTKVMLNYIKAWEGDNYDWCL